MLRPGETSGAGTVLLAAVALAVAVVLGSWWTASAVVDGHTMAVLGRFAASMAGASYYLVMFRVAAGKPLALR